MLMKVRVLRPLETKEKSSMFCSKKLGKLSATYRTDQKKRVNLFIFFSELSIQVIKTHLQNSFIRNMCCANTFDSKLWFASCVYQNFINVCYKLNFQSQVIIFLAMLQENAK
jgi:hypothetical protein